MISGVVGGVATLTVAFIGLYEAFQAGLKKEAQLGTCYGLMWGACDVPPQDKVWKDTIAGDSAEDRSEAFHHAAQLGMGDGKVTATRNKILLLVAANMLRIYGDKARTPDASMEWVGQHELLNELGNALVEIGKPNDMDWPKPNEDFDGPW